MIHRTIKKVTDDIEGRFHFNTAIAAIMELFNALSAAAQDRRKLKRRRADRQRRAGSDDRSCSRRSCRTWRASCGSNWAIADSLDQVPWPSYSPRALEEEQLLIVVQVNGKVRGKITVPADVDPGVHPNRCVGRFRVIGFLEGKKVQRVVYVPRRLVNIVVEG